MQSKFILLCGTLLPLTAAAGPTARVGTASWTLERLVVEGPITGTVVDEKGQGLPGVTVLLKGTSVGATTGPDGQFTLVVPSGTATPTLVISYVGYQKQEVLVGNQSTLSLKLVPDSQSLDDVVVVGYGTQRKSDLTGSVVSIKGAELTKIGGNNAAEALQGKAPGVTILNQGTPGAAPLVYIRGLGTNGDASPLYVVDGMFVGNITFLAPSDISSMEILKDASATAIYGSRGANGVVLITTKKGRNGKPIFNFNTSQGFQFLTRKYEVGNAKQYAQLVNLFRSNAGQAPLYSDTDINGFGEGTNWLNESLQKGYVADYQASVAGGSENVTYNVSLTYHKEDGVLKFTNFDRLTLRANNEYKLSKWLTIGNNLSLASTNYKGDSQWNGGRGINSLYRASPLLPIYQPDGTFTRGQDTDIVNPYAALYLNKDVKTHPLQFVGNAFVNAEVLPGLSFRSSYGVDYTLTRLNTFLPAYSLGSNQSQVATVQGGYLTYNTWLWENTLTYDKQLGDHHFNLLAGYTAQNYDYNPATLAGTGLLSTDPNYTYLQALPITGATYLNGLPTSESIASYLFRANYNYKGRYLLTASFRGDGSSKFAPGRRWGYFPSVALGWNVSEENFLKNAGWISNLKVRGSFGQIGSNKISNYQYYNTLYQETTYNGVFNGVFYPNATIIAASNPDITWEVSQQTDFGVEFGTLGNRLKLEADYYNRDTKNLLLQLPIPGGSSGLLTAGYSNVGTVRNRGYELAVSWNDKVGDFTYGVRLTGATNKNTILDFGNQTVYTGDFMIPSTHVSKAGQSIGSFYGYVTDGIVQNQGQIDALNANAVAISGVAGRQYWAGLKPGDLLFKDLNGDGIINVNDKTDIGSPFPKFTSGLTLTAGFKGFDFSVDMYGSFGAKIYNDSRNQILASGLSNMNVEWLNSWTPTNTNTDIPRYAANTTVSQQSDFNIQSGTYIKARFAELGYTFSNSLLSKIKMSSLRLYVNTTNPFYITKYRGFSPEISNSYGVTTMGDDFRTYPVSGTARIGVNVTF